MNPRFKIFGVALITLCFIALFSGTVFAQNSNYSMPEAAEQSPLVETPKLADPGAEDISSTETRIEPEEFGTTGWIYTWIPAAAFEQRGGPQYFTYWDNGYIYRTAGANHFWAPVNLPSGAYIWDIRLYCYDNSANNIGLYYIRYSTDTNGTAQLKQKFTDGTPYFTTIGFDPFPNDFFDNYHQHVVIVFLPDTNVNTMFKGVRIRYKRRISDPPATPTFSDVPTSAWYYQNVEALAAAGITTGWGGTNEFKPDYYVTRAQMAAFISRALGIYHTDPIN